MADEQINTELLLKEAKLCILSVSNVQKGVKILKKILKSNPKHFWALIYYGTAAQKTNHFEEAFKIFARAASINPEAIESWRGIISCTKYLSPDKFDAKIVKDAYTNVLRYEPNKEKWVELFSYVETNYPDDVISILSPCVDEDPICDSFKHKTACSVISLKALEEKISSETIVLAFKGYFKSLDFYNRPLFGKKAIMHLLDLKDFDGLVDFLYYSFASGSVVNKSKVFLAQTIVHIASHDIQKAGKVIPFISDDIKKLSKNSHMMGASDNISIQMALAVILYHEGHFLQARDLFETRSYKGNIHSTLMLLKIMLGMSDYEGVLFLVAKLGRSFLTCSMDQQLHAKLMHILIEALSHANDVSYLKLALRLSKKCVKTYGWDPSLLSSMCYACVGLKDRKVFYYLNKLRSHQRYSDECEYLCSLLKEHPSAFSQDSSFYVLNQFHFAILNVLRGKISKAIKNCMLAGERDRQLSDCYIILGLYYELNSALHKAGVCYDKARKNRPRDEIALRLLCNVLLSVDQEDMALTVLESNQSNLFNKWHWTAEKMCLAAAEIRILRSEYTKAMSSLRHAQKLNPDCEDIMERIAENYAEMRMLGCAENYYQRVLSHDLVNLRSMLALTQLRKLTLNHSEFYINSIKCINCILTPGSNVLDFRFSIALFFSYLSLFHLNASNTSSDSFENSMKKLLIKVIKKLDSTYRHDWSSCITKEKLVEYPIAIYLYIESHLLAAVKLVKRNDFKSALEAFEFIINATCRLIKIHGSGHPAFWKLLGDSLVESSLLSSNIQVPSWLVDPSEPDSLRSTTRSERLSLSAKCYGLGLDIVSTNTPERVHEFYFDMAISLAKISNLPETLCPLTRKSLLTNSFRYACASFVHYPSVTNDMNGWIHFNLMGSLASMLGLSCDLFNGPFSNFSVSVVEETRVMNQGILYLKNGCYDVAVKMFEHGRLLGDTNYASPWVGQLLTYILSELGHDEKMGKLVFQLKHLGNHPLILWICTMMLFNNVLSKEFFEEERMFRDVLERGVKCESANASRLTVLGYCLEKAGELLLARKTYIMALRNARFSSDHSMYDILLQNVVRLSGRCNLSLDLINCIESTSAAVSSLSCLILRHLSLASFNEECYVKYLHLIKHVIDNSKDTLPYVHLLPATFLTSPMVPSLPILIEHPHLLNAIFANYKILTKYSIRDLKSLFTSLPPSIQNCIFHILENYHHIANLKSQDDSSVKLFSVDESVADAESILDLSMSSKSPSVSFHIKSQTHSYDHSIQEVKMDQVNSNIFANKNYPYSLFFSKMRASVFPPTIPYQELYIIRQQKIVENQEKIQNDQKRSVQEMSVSPLVSPSLHVSYSDDELSHRDAKTILDSHSCHFLQKKIVLLMYQCLKKGLHNIAAKYCYLCLDIRCYKCLNIRKLIPIIAFLAVRLKNVKLLVKSTHLYPDEIILRKCLILMK